MSPENHIKQIVKRDGTIQSFNRERIYLSLHKAAASVGVHDNKACDVLTNQVIKALNSCFRHPDMPLVSEIQDIVENTLINASKTAMTKAYILHRDYRRRARDQKRHGKYLESQLPYKTMFETLLWNVDHHCDTIEKLNTIVQDNRLEELRVQSDWEYNDSILNAALSIEEVKNNLKLIIVAGPSSSGKTTTTAKLAYQLKELGIDAVPIILDHYFFDLEQHPRDEFGDHDFETPEALDIKLINQHLRRLINGETIMMPHYDFTVGKRTLNVTEKAILPNQIILIDTLHGLYKPMTEGIPDAAKFKVYIETISMMRDRDNKFLRWTDIRLLRRIVRDFATRGYDPFQTICHWHYVRRSEMKHIIPFIGEVDYIINGALPYELPFLKKYAHQYFPQFLEKLKDDSLRKDAYIRADRIYKWISQIPDFGDESILPGDSLLREFIGGSIYKLH